jgi:hypothetical protein
LFEMVRMFANRDERFQTVGVTPIIHDTTYRMVGALLSTPVNYTCIGCGQSLVFSPPRVEGFLDDDDGLSIVNKQDLAAHDCGFWPMIATSGIKLENCHNPDRIRVALDRLAEERDEEAERIHRFWPDVAVTP